MTPQPTLTIHRAADEIGGNCVEIAYDGHRILLDAGSPLETADPAGGPVPTTLDTSRSVDAVIVSHPHQDHYGLLRSLPADWPVWSGAPTETLARMTVSLIGNSIEQTFRHYASGEAFIVGPFTITPYLTDHSAFDAHMLLVEVGGKRILYSGDFRTTGRKSVLVRRFMQKPPVNVDVLLLEGTTIGRTGAAPTETEIEGQFIDLFGDATGRVFVTWSAQNIDRTVSIYRACLQTGRPLVVDLYTANVLERLCAFGARLPRLGLKRFRVVVTKKMMGLHDDPARLADPAFVQRCVASGRAFGAAKLQSGPTENVIMLRPTLLRDYHDKGVVLRDTDTWVFSMWPGYLKKKEFQQVEREFAAAGAKIEIIHTSGHAGVDDLVDLVEAVNPKRVIPIHTEHADAYGNLFPSVTRLVDGQPLPL